MAAHRYWRFLITASNGGGFVDVETLLLLAAGTNVATNPASASASSAYAAFSSGGTNYTFDASNAVAGQAGDWSAAAAALPQWWAYDLGAGVTQDVTSASITNRPQAPNWTTDSPTAVQVQFSDDNATWTTAFSGTPAWSGPSQTIAFSAPATGVTIAPNNAALVFSPYNWQVTATAATTWNAGAYLRTLFTGASCALLFDTSLMVSPFSQFYWRIDGGPWTLANVAASVALTIPAATAGSAAVPIHRLEVVVKSIDITTGVNRWIATAAGAVRFQGLTLAAGGTVQAPGKAPLNILLYGDSISEGARTLGEGGASDCVNMDAMFCWALEQGRLLGAEVGIVAFCGLGYTSGVYSVPSFPNSYALLAAGVPRSFLPAPDLVVINHGTNDGTTNLTSAAVTAVNGLLAVVTCKIALLNAFPLADNTYLAAVPAACSAPSRVTWLSTAGFFVRSAGSDAAQIHPSGPNSANLIAPKVAAILRPFFTSQAAATVARWTHFGGGVASIATAFTTALSAASGVVGTAVTMVFSPSGGTWPAGVVITPTTTLTGTFSPTSVAPSGGAQASITFTPTAAATGSLNSSASPAMTNTSGAQTYTATAAAGGARLLDAISPAPVMVLACKRLLTSYTGAAMTVRRSSDGATSSVAFLGTDKLDTASMVTFAGAASANVTSWSDQSGGTAATQSTVSLMPFAVYNGTLQVNDKGAPCTGYYQACLLHPLITGAVTVFVVASRNGPTREVSELLSSAGGFEFSLRNTYLAAADVNKPSVGTPGSGVFAWVNGVKQVSANPMDAPMADGVTSTIAFTAASVGGNSGSLTIGMISDLSQSLSGTIWGLIIFPAVLPDAQVVSISNALTAAAVP